MTKRLVLKPTEAADALGVGRSRVYKLIAQGMLPTVRVGKRVRIPVEGLSEWIRNQVNEHVGNPIPSNQPQASSKGVE